MPPLSTEGEVVSNVGGLCPGSCPLQVILGCILPFIAVASSIPVIMIKRHLAYKSSIHKSKAQTITPRALATPRLPMTSVYIARVNYYLPTSDTAASQSVVESHLDGSSTCLAANNSESPAPSLSIAAQVPPMTSLPSLSSMLCEFTAYADAIEPEVLTEARRSSTCLLDSVFSSMDVKALSFTTLPPSLSLPQVQGLAISTPSEYTIYSSKASDFEEGQINDSEQAYTTSAALARESDQSEPSFVADELAGGSVEEEQDCPVEPSDDMDIGALLANAEDDVEEISTSQLVTTTTSWSIILDSSSTLASVLAVRLAEFPTVPAFPPSCFTQRYGLFVVTHQSKSSLDSTVTRSISAPASLNILDIRIEDTLRQRRPDGPYLIEWPSFSNPGELWDEEDDLLFSTCLPQKPIDLSKPVRYTWTAGVAYSRSDKGELWDDEDDRRFSCVSESKALETFSSPSNLSLAMASDCFMALSTLSTSEAIYLEEQAYESKEGTEEAAKQTVCFSGSDLDVNDSGFAEDISCLDFGVTSVKEQNVKPNPYCKEFASDFWSSTPSSLHLHAFEDLAVNSKPIYLSESSRSSLMSLVSVLDSTVRIVDPAHESENLEKMLGVLDMELEPDFSYSSHIVSVTFPLLRETCTL